MQERNKKNTSSLITNEVKMENKKMIIRVIIFIGLKY